MLESFRGLFLKSMAALPPKLGNATFWRVLERAEHFIIFKIK
jgi:hypothetical protein